jgi:hypothetical protein
MGEGKVLRDGASPSVQTSREVQGEDFRPSVFTTMIRHKLIWISNDIFHLMMAGLNLDAALLVFFPSNTRKLIMTSSWNWDLSLKVEVAKAKDQ